MKSILAPACILSLLISSFAFAQTKLDAPTLAMRSSGAETNGAWKLDSNGFVGTYFTLDAPAKMTVNVEASGVGSPKMGFVIADAQQEFEVTGESKSYSHAFDLPAGMHFVRVQYNDDEPSVDRSLTIRSIELSGTGLTIQNENTDANALAAADSYIENFRKAPASFKIDGAAPGAQAHVKLKRHAFNFATNAPGVQNIYLIDNPPAGSDAEKFQNFIRTHFNMLVPSNGGKWIYHEETRDQVATVYMDQILAFAKANNLRMRMHTLIWDTAQTPLWARELLTQAAAGSDDAKKQLREEISERIDYYVKAKSPQIAEMDILNESLHQPRFWRVYGSEGISEIYAESAKAVTDAGANTKLYLNEFNVIQWSRNPITPRSPQPDSPPDPYSTDPTTILSGGADPYANWYRAHIEDINRYHGAPVTGIGIQYYTDGRTTLGPGDIHSSARIMQALQNLSITGLPISMTEMTINDRPNLVTQERAAQILGETMRMFFGNANCDTYMLWGFWSKQAGAIARSALVGDDWTLLEPGKVYEALMEKWDTDVTVPVGADGTVRFSGFYGEYEITIDGKTTALTHAK